MSCRAQYSNHGPPDHQASAKTTRPQQPPSFKLFSLLCCHYQQKKFVGRYFMQMSIPLTQICPFFLLKFPYKMDDLFGNVRLTFQLTYFQDRSCPLKNEEENIESARMFSTALDKGTMIIPTEKFNFSKSFFISISLAADDSKCHLPTWEGTGSTTGVYRQKSISVKLTLVDSNWKDNAKIIFVPIAVMITVVVVGLIIFLFKIYKDESFSSDRYPASSNSSNNVQKKGKTL